MNMGGGLFLTSIFGSIVRYSGDGVGGVMWLYLGCGGFSREIFLLIDDELGKSYLKGTFINSDRCSLCSS